MRSHLASEQYVTPPLQRRCSKSLDEVGLFFVHSPDSIFRYPDDDVFAAVTYSSGGGCCTAAVCQKCDAR